MSIINIYLNSFIAMITCLSASAQVPNFAGTAGKDYIYGYFSFKARPSINNQETYSKVLFGSTNWMSLGADYYTCTGVKLRIHSTTMS